MELNYQTVPDFQPVPKKQHGSRTVLNIIGLVIFGGLLLQSLTVPFTLDGSGGLSQIEEIKMNTSEFLEFFFFTLGCGTIYYLLVNLYFTGEKGKQAALFIIALLGIFSVLMVVYLVQRPLSH
jgi:ABC-type transport system involved in cytochrome c biogenesis permease subunit